MTTDLDLAPPPVPLGGGRSAVPVDVSAVTALLRFDGASRTATGTATLRFATGPAAGCPVLDLRQTVTGVRLDGAPLPPDAVVRRDLGGGAGAEVLVLDRVLPAGSAHTLRLDYTVGPPQAPAGGSHPPALTWSAGPRLTLSFGFTDLAPGRYLESWVPANLIWDRYSIDLELVVTGTAVEHRVVTNGAVTAAGPHHWRVAFPPRSSALSPMVEVRAADTLTAATTTVALPTGGDPVAVEVLALRSDTTVDPAAAAADVAGWLAENAAAVGRYVHGGRYTAFLIRGGMEYDGACTASRESLRHEVFHSWWGRGVTPAAQADGWWDEGWNVYHDRGGSEVRPFDFAEPPVTLSPRDPYTRATPIAAYSTGARLFAGAAALASPAALTGWMGEFYRANLERPATTEALEAHLVARSGAVDLVDAFHRWVYGLPDPAPVPELWLREDPGGRGGGRFWDSPDLWIRHEDDGGTVHQQPRAGRDNWFHARVRNRGRGTARHLVVTFGLRRRRGGLHGTWPGGFLPAVTAAVAFELPPGRSTVVRARWPAAQVPPAGVHVALAAAALTRGGSPPAGSRVGERGDLAQKDLTVVRAPRGAVVLVPFDVRGTSAGRTTGLEVRRPRELARVGLRIARPRADAVPVTADDPLAAALEPPARPDTDRAVLVGSEDEPAGGSFDLTAALPLPEGPRAVIDLPLPLGPSTLALLLTVPRDLAPGTEGTVDVLRREESGQVAGGFAVRLVVDP
ncbi:hypothetical protein ACI780_12255 [Geodermatophilus sp. SYSU D00814]